MFRFLANWNGQKFHKFLLSKGIFSFLILSWLQVGPSWFQVVARCFEVVARCLLHIAWPAGWLDEWLISPICCTAALDPNNFILQTWAILTLIFKRLTTNLLHGGAWSEQFQWISQIISSLDFISHLDFICNSLIFHDWNLLFKFPHAFILQTWAKLTLIFKRLSKIDFDIQKIEIIYQSWHQPRNNWLWQVTQSLP